MNDADRISSLKAEHQALDHSLEEEMRRPAPDPDTIAEIKKKKLHIKDQLAALGQG